MTVNACNPKAEGTNGQQDTFSQVVTSTAPPYTQGLCRIHIAARSPPCALPAHSAFPPVRK